MEKKFSYSKPRCLTRLPVTEHGEDIVAALVKIRQDVDCALQLAVTVLGQYVDREVRPLEAGTPPRNPTPLADRQIRMEIEQAIANGTKKTA